MLRSDSVKHLQVSVNTLMPATLQTIDLEEVRLTYHSMLQTNPKFWDDVEMDLRKVRSVDIILVVWHRKSKGL